MFNAFARLFIDLKDDGHDGARRCHTTWSGIMQLIAIST
jgi:hypothetical protein